MSKYININDFMQPEYATTFIIGARGVGKTVSSISQSIKRCYKNGTKFIYLRRYQAEIDSLGLNLPLIRKLTGLDVEIDNVKDDSGRSSKMISVNEGDQNIGLGYLLALSVAGKYKSNDYTGTDLIIYDEFIDTRMRELKNETELFNNFAMTVFRDFNDYRALFLANATNLFNNYFVDWNVMPQGKVTKYKDLGIKIVIYQTDKELNKRNKTQLAKLVAVTEGEDNSSLDNVFADAKDNSFLRKNGKNAKCIRILRVKGIDYGEWRNDNWELISTKYDPQCKTRITLDDLVQGYDLDINLLGYLRDKLYHNHVYFDNIKTRGVFIKLLKYGES